MNTARKSRRQNRVGHLLAIGSLAVVSILATAPAAVGSVTIGQVAPNPGSLSTCAPDADRVQPTINSGPAYVVPSTGNVTAWTLSSWSTLGGSGSGDKIAMKVFRPAGGNDYSVVGHDGPRTLSANSLNTFSTSFPVKPGDFVGLYTVTNATPCIYDATGENYLYRSGNLADGASGTFSSSGAAPDFRLNISALLDPINSFTLGAITRNKKKGTATETATVPNPGAVTVSGDGVKQASSSGARSAVSVPSAGTVSVPIRAKGKKKKKLNQKGKVKLSVAITYTPTGGAPSTQSVKVKLLKKKKKV